MHRNNQIGSKWILLVAKRYLTGKSNRRYMSSVFTILGLITGFITIFVIIGIMNGLQIGYIDDIVEIASFHAQVKLSDDADEEQVLREIRLMESVASAVRFNETNALLEYKNGQYYPCRVRGVEDSIFTMDKGFLEHTSLLGHHITSLHDRDIIVSESLMNSLSAVPGHTIHMMLMGVGKVVKHVPFRFDTTIIDTYKSGFPDIDSNLIFTSLDTLQKLLPNQQPLIGVKFLDKSMIDRSRRIAEIDGVEQVTTWKEANQSFYSALMLEKYSMLLLLCLIFLVVIMNAKSSFEKYVFYKKDDIGILRSLGASRGAVYSIFLIQGVLIVLCGILLGSSLGYLTAYHVNGIIHVVERLCEFLLKRKVTLLLYEFPVIIQMKEVLVVSISILVISMINIIFAIKTLVKKSPLEIMWYE